MTNLKQIVPYLEHFSTNQNYSHFLYIWNSKLYNSNGRLLYTWSMFKFKNLFLGALSWRPAIWRIFLVSKTGAIRQDAGLDLETESIARKWKKTKNREGLFTVKTINLYSKSRCWCLNALSAHSYRKSDKVKEKTAARMNMIGPG